MHRAPATFTPEQICAIVALACEQPAAESDLPLSLRVPVECEHGFRLIVNIQSS